jgi:hypothetical protein
VTGIASKLSYPCARSEDLIVEELGEELLVYDMKVDRGHCLSPMAARVWRRCDGRTPATDMSADLDLDPDAVGRALDELAACKLLEPTPGLNVVGAGGNGLTRREVASRLVKAGAVAAAAPLIVSVVAPTPAQAQTLAFCRAAAVTPGCGLCNQRDCCCCNPDGGVLKDCVPDVPAGWIFCCELVVDPVFSTGCSTPADFCGPAETESTELERQSQQPTPTDIAPQPGAAPTPEPGAAPAPEPGAAPAPEPTPIPEVPAPEAPPPGTTTTPATGTEPAPTP